MEKTIILVTNQYSCDRIIYAARTVADETDTELCILEILDGEYELNPQAVDYLFMQAKQNRAVMRVVIGDDKLEVLREAIDQEDVAHVVTGMPGSNKSILYSVWKEFPDKQFHVVDQSGEIIEVARTHCASA
ncbi:MAG: hypothetical protein LBU86_07490 [Oscillospiraceae bacterium]|jgi:K+-sensing histidine kinase KdpD|nr:hypothetical protein [Oscillospiraceae bacterium]